MSIDLKTALSLVSAATEKAASLETPMYIAVVDQGGNLVAQHRMDGAILVSESLSRDKAYTALATRMPTDELGRLSQPGQPLFGIDSCGSGRMVTFGGGYPLTRGNKCIGAIGVSGGSVDEDMAVALAGRDALQATK